MNVLIAIIAAPVGAASFALAIVWHIRSTTSPDWGIRVRAWIAEFVMAFAVAVLSTVTGTSGKERRIAILVIAGITAAWLFRLARLLLNKRRA